MTKAELIDAYEDWLLQYHWHLFATLTFRTSASISKANRLFLRWIKEMRDADGDNDFRWARVTEYGAFGDNLHFHALIGGLRDGCKWPWVLRWDELAGDSWISYYIACGGGIRYMLKGANPDRDFDFDADFGEVNEVQK
jgi:hypothetical protein